jgi:hypothetical protein
VHERWGLICCARRHGSLTGIQWNFFFSKEWAAFGEIGPMLRTDFDAVLPDLYVAAGGRYLFSDGVGLTLRIGFPFVTLRELLPLTAPHHTGDHPLRARRRASERASPGAAQATTAACTRPASTSTR